MSDSNSSSGGIGFFGLLAILFIGLKLGHVIDWEWAWILSPIWGPFAMVLAVLTIIGIAIGAVMLWESIFGDLKAKR